MSQQWLIVGLVAIYPILMLVNVNVDEVIFADTSLPLFLSIFISITLYLILSIITKEKNIFNMN